MAAKRLIFSPAAEADLEQIWRYTAETWNPDQADEYIMQIHSSCTELATGRRKGRSLADIRAGYLKLSIGSHFIVYRIVDETIDVVRILHQRMDIGPRLEK
ncbi:type II toxin-antitoxin system RelE/ParE family toxin [Aminobacter aminovorans]|uniref:type II toxin-antitoxin system RelE/ParE family toxin n=1 Tax=Aminobacter aminovorans TaxID=83263 RepID=UPI0028579992|nr:type II toxin-antitoxin system RelE/ParE family toxin [Aminobacter aminovorans]MDR7222180.1 toxin ParE1/3/4 [Aminobacter aminovorans]